MSNKIECTECGSFDMEAVNETLDIKIDELQTKKVVYSFYRCRNCGDKQGGDENQIEAKNKELAKKSISQTVQDIFSDFKSRKINITDLERKLGYAPRTIHRWKTNNPDASGLLLLKYMHHLGWFVDIAEAGFDINKTLEIIAKNFPKEYSRSFQASEGVLVTWVIHYIKESVDKIDTKLDSMIEFKNKALGIITAIAIIITGAFNLMIFIFKK